MSCQGRLPGKVFWWRKLFQIAHHQTTALTTSNQQQLLPPPLPPLLAPPPHLVPTFTPKRAAAGAAIETENPQDPLPLPTLSQLAPNLAVYLYHHDTTAAIAALAANAVFARNLTPPGNVAFTRRQRLRWMHDRRVHHTISTTDPPTSPHHCPTTTALTVILADVAIAVEKVSHATTTTEIPRRMVHDME